MRWYQCDDFFEDDEIFCRCCFGGRGSELSEAQDRIKVLERRVRDLQAILKRFGEEGAVAVAATMDPPPKPPKRMIPVAEALLMLHKERAEELARAMENLTPHKIPNGASVES